MRDRESWELLHDILRSPQMHIKDVESTITNIHKDKTDTNINHLVKTILTNSTGNMTVTAHVRKIDSGDIIRDTRTYDASGIIQESDLTVQFHQDFFALEITYTMKL